MYRPVSLQTRLDALLTRYEVGPEIKERGRGSAVNEVKGDPVHERLFGTNGVSVELDRANESKAGVERLCLDCVVGLVDCVS